LNLGDSIAFGMSASEGMSYFEKFAAFKQTGASINLAVPGATTADLLASLNTKEYKNAVKRADVITICIGGNNLLQPVIAAVFMAYGLDPEVNSIEQLLVAIATFGGGGMAAQMKWGMVTEAIIASGQKTTPGQLGYLLVNGQANFGSEMPQILSGIRALNTEAKIVVLNLYNPFSALESPALYGLFELLAGPMNYTLGLNNNPSLGCYVLNVHDAFAYSAVGDPVNFSLMPMTLSLDIHPNNTGHGIIFSGLVSLDLVDEFMPPGKMAQ
jgi:lysophospholipase L1-like esterase